MSEAGAPPTRGVVNTVLGAVAADRLGVVAVSEALLSVVPGAEHAYDITIDRAEVFALIEERLGAFKAAGGGTIVDTTGMFHGRDVRLLEALSRATGIHIVASTGMGPEDDLGGYFLTPQTNPPTPWPAERFAALFGAEVTEGMVVPRVERRGPAGVVVTTTTAGRSTPTDQSLVRGAARAALTTGVPLVLHRGADPAAEVQQAVGEGLGADRIAVEGAGDATAALAEAGTYVVFTDLDAAVRFARAGHADRTLVATGGAAVAFGHEPPTASYADLLAAVPSDLAEQLLVRNPATLLTVR